MCGRFALTLPPEAVAGWFDASLKATFESPRYNICPTQMIPAVVAFGGQVQMVAMRWGFVPHWYKAPNDGPMLINARAETITEKPAFRKAVQSRRCLIPASGFYEWHNNKGVGKEPWYLRPAADELMAFGGIWQAWTSPEGLRHITCAIVTTAAGPMLDPIHHREPVTIAQPDRAAWLAGDKTVPIGLMQAAPDEFFAVHRVSTEVNSAGHDTADLIAPIDG